MKEITKKALVISIIAGILVLCDGLITSIFKLEGSFTWVAFISWTVFFGATTKERMKAVVGYVIGFISAVTIIYLGNWLNFIPINIFSVTLGSLLATMLINYLCIELERVDKHFPISTSGTFVGIALTFSGLGIGLGVDTIQNSITMLSIIVAYGILGLLSGWATLKFGMKNKK